MTGRRFDFEMKLYLGLVFGLCFSLATPIIHGLGYTVPDFFARLFYTALCLAVYTLIHLFPFLAAAIPLCLLSLAAYYLWTAPHLLDQVSDLFRTPQPADALFWPLVIIGATALILYLLVFKMKNPLALLFGAGLLTFAPLWYLFVDSALPCAVTYNACWLMLFSYKRGLGLWGKLPQDKQEPCALAVIRRGWLGYTASILALAILLTLVLPKEIAPAPFHPLHRWVDEKLSFLPALRGSEESGARGDAEKFDLFSGNFQEGDELGGPLWLDETVLLEVTGRGGIYLKGSVSDHYTGRGWVNEATLTEWESFPAPPKSLQDCLVEVELKIRHLRLRTKSVFSISYPAEILRLPGTLRTDRNSNLFSSFSIPLNHEYRVKGRLLAYRTDFSALETEIEEEAAELEEFLRLPAGLPSRVRRLAVEITGERQGNYEKMKALETYLRRHYRYNTEMPHLPEDRDFADYFLFDLEEGYCTYFATALAVLGRAAGVPTRYVVGFTVPGRPAEGEVYRLSGTDAHAWVEGYIPGAGWLPFEATPGFRTIDALPLRRETPDRETPDGELNGQTAPPDNMDVPDSYPDHLLPGDNGTDTVAFSAYVVQALLVAVLAFLLALVAFALIRLRQVKKMLQELDRREARPRAVGYYNLALSFLARIALGKYPGETPREYSRRIIRDVYSWTINFKEISEGINLALYSREEIASELAEQAEQFFRYAFKRYLAQVGKWKAFAEILLQGRYFTF